MSEMMAESRSNPEGGGINRCTTSEKMIGMFPTRKEEKRSSKCVVYALATTVSLLVVLCFSPIVLAVAVRDPKIELRSVRLMGKINHGVISASSSFNVSMIGRVTLWNPNFGSFYYGNSTVSVMYGVSSIGASKLEVGRMKAREIKELNSMVKMRFSKLLVTANRTDGIRSGMLKLRWHSELSGIVHVLNIIKKRKTIQMACIMDLDLTSYSVRHLQC